MRIFAELLVAERARLKRARRRPAALTALSIPVAAAATLGMAIYLVSTSLPQLVDAPAADPLLGALNRCLISTLREPPSGFAVAPGGAQVASYGASSLAVCEKNPSRPGDGASAGVHFAFGGVTAASFDFEGNLWLAAAQGPRPALWVARASSPLPLRVGEVAPVALVGLPDGVATLEASGRLSSFRLSAGPPSSTFVPASSSALLSVNADGSLIGVVTAGAVHLLRSSDLAPVRQEASCAAQFLWWLPAPTRALVSCGEGEPMLLLDAWSGAKRTGAPAKQPRSSLVPLLGTYVQSCDQLPCSAPPPNP